MSSLDGKATESRKVHLRLTCGEKGSATGGEKGSCSNGSSDAPIADDSKAPINASASGPIQQNKSVLYSYLPYLMVSQ